MDTALKHHDASLVRSIKNPNPAKDYDTWFRSKVQDALDSGKEPMPHSEVVSRMRAKLAERLNNAG